MNSDFCEWEESVAQALSTGAWTVDLRQHAATCPHCAARQLVSQYLSTIAAAEDTAPLPAPGLIWWRAQLAERREHAERAVAAIDLMQKLALVVALIAVVAITLIWHPLQWSVLLEGAALLISTTAVLYGWVRGRI